jgi:putative FmdB family regulatory protein
MPIFEYICEDCDSRFEVIVQGSAVPVCPACEGAKLKKQLSVFAVGATPAAAERGIAPCGACGDPRGPGSCSLD